MKKERILFRFVPTMKCNFRCDYCFVSNDEKSTKKTMFDEYSVDKWIEGMKNFSDKDVEFYFWGGEPFVLDDTYTLLREWCKMDNVVSGCRIDTNIFFAEKIAKLCPSSKIKLNCSYHMKYHTLDEQFRKIKLLKDLDMVGMMNFVASEYNLNKLKNDYNMTVDDLIEKFQEIGVFVNVAGDFNIVNNPEHPLYSKMKKFVSQYTCNEDWKFLRGNLKEVKCSAGEKFFTVNYDGSITSCIDGGKNTFGNFFTGELNPLTEPVVCNSNCPSLIAYPFREDNDFESKSNLLEYVNRNEEYRRNLK